MPNKGDLDGTGTASVTVNVGQQRVCWDIDVAGIASPTRGHIHKAPSTTTGGVVVTFFETDSVDLDGCTTSPVDRELLKDILKNPQEYYVNVHNADFPAGALRGRLASQGRRITGLPNQPISWRRFRRWFRLPGSPRCQ